MVLSQKLSTSVNKTSFTLGRFLPQKFWNEPKYEYLASDKHLLEREINTRFLIAGILYLASMPSAKSAIPLILYFERAEMLLSINEVATSYLKVSRSTVYRLVDQGQLQMVHVRGCARISQDSVSSYIKRISSGY
jgi:excisionase family DNA binding protein